MTEDTEPQFSDDEIALLKSMIDRERGWRALGRMGRWLSAVVTITAIILGGAYAVNRWIIEYIRKAAGDG